MECTKDNKKDFESLFKKEWLLTNGLGGFASSTICGCNTRKYHGLLVTSFSNDLNRRLLVSKVNECVKINEEVYDISTNECPRIY